MTILVMGHGRCGLSLVMQMLAAGGYPCVGEYPAYEGVLQSNGANVAEIVADNREKAIKLVSPTHYVPALEAILKLPAVAVILLSRSPIQQAKSQLKFLHFMRIVKPGRYDVARMAAGCVKDQEKLEQLTAGVPRLKMSFEQICAQKRAAAQAIADLAGGVFDVARAARQVEKRASGCLMGMLERVLVQRQLRP